MRAIAAMNLPAFNAVLIDPQGRISSHKLESASVEQARAIAAGRGHTILECTPAQAAGGWFSLARLPLGKRSIALDTVAFSQDLATLMEAGVTVKDGVDALARREPSPARRLVLDRVNALVSEGLRFSYALEHTQAFPDLLVATVAASEQTGDVAIGLRQVQRHAIPGLWPTYSKARSSPCGTRRKREI
jgi:general secretion pathway protein F